MPNGIFLLIWIANYSDFEPLTKSGFLTLKFTKSWTVHVRIASRPTGTVMFVIGAVKLGSTVKNKREGENYGRRPSEFFYVVISSYYNIFLNGLLL